jgi:hypothetical protein
MRRRRTARRRVREKQYNPPLAMKLSRKIGDFALSVVVFLWNGVMLCILRALRLLFWLLLAWMISSVAVGSVIFFFGLDGLGGRISDSLPDSLVVRELICMGTGGLLILSGRFIWRVLERNAAIRAEKEEQ